MTASRERVFTALSHQQPDRVPVDLFWQREEILDQLKAHFKVPDVEGVRQALGVDLIWGPDARVSYPDFEHKIAAKNPGKKFVFHDARTFEDEWGTVERWGSDGKYVEWLSGPLVQAQSLSDVEHWDVPKHRIESAEDLAPRVKALQAQDYVTIAGVSLPFKMAWRVCGMENWLMHLIADEELAEFVLDKLYAFDTEIAVTLAKAGVDIISIVGDIAAQNSLMFSPAIFRKLEKPRLAKLIAACKAANPKVKLFYHCDGNLEAIIGDWIDIGLDILNPIQPDCMDPAVIKKKFGKNLCFHGTLSVQETIPFGTVADVKNEVALRVKTVGENGGFILAPANVISYDTPLANVLAIYEAAGSYKP